MGPDAFAGIVNIVPMQPKDLENGFLSVDAGSDNRKNAHIGFALDKQPVSALLTLRKSENRFHDPDYEIYSLNRNRAVEAAPASVEDSDYTELLLNGSVDQWLHFFARLSDFKRQYTVFEKSSDLKWDGVKETPVSTAGLTASAGAGPSNLKFSAYYQHLSYLIQDMNTRVEETLDKLNAEFLWDRRMFKKGLLTLGGSFRENRITGAQVLGGFDPEAVLTPFSEVSQDISQADYETSVASFFSQFRYQAGDLQLWAGARMDSHSEYGDHTTWNLGASWYASEQWQLRGVLGTAYRTPYSQQVFEQTSSNADSIDTLSLEFKYTPSSRFEIALTPFFSSVTGYADSDPSAGLSEPLSRDIYGAELSGRASFTQADLFANISVNQSEGEDYLFRKEDFRQLAPDGTVNIFYDTWNEPFETVPELMANLGVLWRIKPDVTLWSDLSYTDPVDYSFAMDSVSGSYSAFWLARAELKIKDLVFENSSLSLGIDNIFDTDHEFSGYYGPVQGRGRSFIVKWQKTW